MHDSLQPKKLLIMNILDILRRYTDADHRLSQQDIIAILKQDYQMSADRKAVKRNLMNLVDFGYQIEYDEIARTNARGEEETICTNWYIDRDFTDEELRLLIDGVLFSKYIPYKQCVDLIEKLKKQSNKYFAPKVRHICNLPESTGPNKQLFYNIEILDEAIERRLKIGFHYLTHDSKGCPQIKTGRTGYAIDYLVNPFQMVATNGRYFLIGNNDAHPDMAHFRVDRIIDIKLTDQPAKDVRDIEGYENGFNLTQHMAEHVYMHSGKSVRVRLRVNAGHIDEIVDWFGQDVEYFNQTEDTVDVSLRVNRSAMKYWALQYSLIAEVIEPKDLRAEVKSALTAAVRKYQ